MNKRVPEIGRQIPSFDLARMQQDLQRMQTVIRRAEKNEKRLGEQIGNLTIKLSRLRTEHEELQEAFKTNSEETQKMFKRLMFAAHLIGCIKVRSKVDMDDMQTLVKMFLSTQISGPHKEENEKAFNEAIEIFQQELEGVIKEQQEFFIKSLEAQDGPGADKADKEKTGGRKEKAN